MQKKLFIISVLIFSLNFFVNAQEEKLSEDTKVLLSTLKTRFRHRYDHLTKLLKTDPKKFKVEFRSMQKAISQTRIKALAIGYNAVKSQKIKKGIKREMEVLAEKQINMMLNEITDQIKSLRKELSLENEKLQSSLSEEEKKKIKKKINDIKEDIKNEEESYDDAFKNGQKQIPQMIKELLDRSFIF